MYKGPIIQIVEMI